MTADLFTTTITGAARIGPNRELKRATESYWAGRIDRSELESTAAGLRRAGWSQMVTAGLDSVPINTFSFYDQMLDTAVLLGALPKRYAAIADDLDRYFAAARGTSEVTPLEMTKWFDTNYHYLVPEISDDIVFALDPQKILTELREAALQKIPARPVIIGPITFLLLSKATGNSPDPISRIDELIPLYVDLLEELSVAGADWVQIDEPALCTDLNSDTLAAVSRVYDALAADYARPAICVTSYFGELREALPQIGRAHV